MVDRGSGAPVVLVPGIQGRWEWMAPTVEALASRCRVLAFSLCDEPTSTFGCDAALGFENYLRQLDDALDRAGVQKATIIGVSYGGLIAAEFAARRPERVKQLILVSALPLDWTPDRRARFYLRAPKLLSPLFFVGSPARILPEIRTAIPARTARTRFLMAYGARVMRAFLSPERMARRIRWAEAHRFESPATIQAPTLVVTGEDRLDRVVPTSTTLRYVSTLRSAEHAVLARTGHIGVVTRPETFADLVSRFVDAGTAPL
jgi:pimeloyl-ACP methyl ester carboxylesterase